MKKILSYLTLLLLFVLQTSLGQYIKIFSVMPNLIFAYAIIYSMTNSALKSAVMGCVCGLLTDVSFGETSYVNALLIMYISLAVSHIYGKHFFENKLVYAGGVFAGTVVYDILIIIITAFTSGSLPFLYTFFRFTVPEAFINSAVSLLFLIYVRWLNNEFVRGI